MLASRLNSCKHRASKLSRLWAVAFASVDVTDQLVLTVPDFQDVLAPESRRFDPFTRFAFDDKSLPLF